MKDLPDSFASLDDARQRGIIISDAADESSVGPLPLVEKERPAEPYPAGALKELGLPARAIAIESQVDIAAASMAVLAVASLAVQYHVNVETHIGRDAFPPSLYCMVIARSGEGKSPVFAAALRGVKEYEADLGRAHVDEMKSYRAARRAYEAAAKHIEVQHKADPAACRAELEALEEPLEPLEPYFTVDDPTFEGLSKVWPKARAGLGLFNDDASVFFSGHSMRDENRAATVARYSKLWSGDTIRRLRAGDDGYSTILRGRRFAMFTMIQPELAIPFLADRIARDQGFTARMLIAEPQTMLGNQPPIVPDQKNLDDIASFASRIRELLEKPAQMARGTRNELEPRTLYLSKEARIAFTAFEHEMNDAVREGQPLREVASWVRKAPQIAARIAAVIEIFRDDDAREVSLVSLEGGIEIARHHAWEYHRLCTRAPVDAKMAHAGKVLEFIQGLPMAQATKSVLMTRGPRPRGKKEIDAAIKALEDHGHIERVRRLSGKGETFRVPVAKFGTLGEDGELANLPKKPYTSNGYSPPGRGERLANLANRTNGQSAGAAILASG